MGAIRVTAIYGFTGLGLPMLKFLREVWPACASVHLQKMSDHTPCHAKRKAIEIVGAKPTIAYGGVSVPVFQIASFSKQRIPIGSD